MSQQHAGNVSRSGGGQNCPWSPWQGRQCGCRYKHGMKFKAGSDELMEGKGGQATVVQHVSELVWTLFRRVVCILKGQCA